MKQVIKKIKETIEECKKDGDMFHMPSLNRNDLSVFEKDLGPKGSALYRNEYVVEFADGGWIRIEYASKDQCHSYQVRPDRSVIEVTCSDTSLNFSNA